MAVLLKDGRVCNPALEVVVIDTGAVVNRRDADGTPVDTSWSDVDFIWEDTNIEELAIPLIDVLVCNPALVVVVIDTGDVVNRTDAWTSDVLFITDELPLIPGNFVK